MKEHMLRGSRALPCLLALFCSLILTLEPAARADDLADEADLHFRIGAERYQARDFRTALEHFHASNRLVPNRNAVFNIARCYEQLQEPAQAYRYYNQALEQESDPTTRTALETAIGRVSTSIAILKVTTDPPGATIFIDRRDLGPRGSSPRTLGFGPGRHVVIAELEGHESAVSEPVELAVGRQTEVRLSLPAIVGTLRVQGEPAGAEIRVDDERRPPLCRIPCEEQLPPGRYLLHFSRDGYQASTQVVTIVAREINIVRPRMSPLTATLVVDADERESLIEIDGRSAGFTPAVLTVPIGTRRLRVSRPGFRPYEQTLTLEAGRQERIEVELEIVSEVSAASRSTESVEDAPSSVSIVTSDDLRTLSPPTIAEALRGVRGVYLSDDHTYQALGFRGLGRPGDYGNRVLVLLDGMPTNDGVSGSSYVGFDGRTDLFDVERIEIVRGTGSVLYGTGAISGVVNLVTERGERPTSAEVAVSAFDNVARARGGFHLRLGPRAGMHASVGVARSEGHDYYFPEFDDPAAGTDGYSRGLDGFEAGTVSGRAWWRDLTVQWMWTSRTKDIPTAEYETLFNVPGTFVTDTRGLAELRYEPRLGDRLRLFARAYVNHYEFKGAFVYDEEDGGTYREDYLNQWAGGELRLQADLHRAVRLTIGGEGMKHFVASMEGVADDGPYLGEDHPFQVGAGYLLADLRPLEALRISAGVRLDAYSTFGTSLNPRLAVILRPYRRGVLKVMAGKAFRAPSLYERYYNDGGFTQVESPDLDPETAYSGEIELTHRLSAAWSIVGAGYANMIEDLVVSQGDGTEEDPTHYVNSDQRVLTVGGELEVRREWRQGWMVGVSYSAQHSRYLGQGESTGRHVPNAPEHLVSLRAAVPIVGRALVGASRITVEGPRWDAYDLADDPSQRRSDPVALWDLVLSGEAERWGIRYSAGVYNVFDLRYELPVSREFTQRSIVQSGRSFLASVAWKF